MSHQDDLQKQRQEIDAIDYQIHDLLNLRATHALEIANIKRAMGSVKPEDFYRPERETQIIERIREYNKGPLTAEAVAEIFKSIMRACLAIQLEED